MPAQANEARFEETTIERLQALGYQHQLGSTIDRPLQTVLLDDLLQLNLRQRYPELPSEALVAAVQRIASPPGGSLDQRNLAFQRLLRDGFDLRYEQDGTERFVHIWPLAFDDWELNDFRVVNQFSIQGQSINANTRRPDIILFINGLPLVVFELKSPWDAYADVVGAHSQLQHYTSDIPQLFTYNAFCVVSDGNTTLHGMYEAPFGWYAPWKSIDGRLVEANTTGSMKTLVEGLFPRDRLLAYLRHFIVHEVVNERITKKGARYHQFFAVRFAVEQALQAMAPEGDGRVGVVWHTQGSGKSLSMIFLTGILRQYPGLNPSIVVQVDRTDLDKQLYDSFVAAKELVGSVQRAGDVDALRALLQNEGSDVICSTIEKFRTRAGEAAHPVLSRRRNILIIADEAHRTQYGLLNGFAANLHEALPGASFVGFTGTPIDTADASTVQLFGDVIHTYDMQQARDDQAVVPLYYEARHIPLDNTNADLDTDFATLVAQLDTPLPAAQIEHLKARMSELERAAGTAQRIAQLAQDLLTHFRTRQEALAGKAMIVCMTRAICVRLAEALTALPHCPEVKVVMTGTPATDPAAWSAAGHLTTKQQRDALKARFVNPDDPLVLVIVCDMWLTGFDAPCVNTIYIDKPMQGHTLMQAIARVNRVFRDKPGGLVVDYIQLEDQLRAATQQYTAGGGHGTLTSDLVDTAVTVFGQQLAATQTCLPPNQPYDQWRGLGNIALEDLCSLCYGTLAGDEPLREQFLDAEYRLSRAYSLVSHLPEGRQHRQEVAFFQLVRLQVRKLAPEARSSQRDLERAVQDLLDASIVALPAVDIFAVAGLPRPDVAILDEAFLAGFAQQPPERQQIQARLLLALMQDEVQRRQRQNLARARSFAAQLDETLTRYNNGSIQATDVVTTIAGMQQQAQADAARGETLGLSDEELAFYDVVTRGAAQGPPYDNAWIADLVREVVRVVRANVRVDWTKDHREDIFASVQSAVGWVLRRRGVKDEQFMFLRQRLMEQAKASYEDWPQVA